MTELKIGKKIRLLRKKNDVTQEKLAQALGVTPQAVSRWESEICYPDIETLPQIADFFGASMDELLCYDSLQKEAKIKEYMENAYSHIERDNLGEALAILREAYAEIPSSFEIQLELAKVISEINAQGKPKKNELIEVVSLCNHILEDCTDDELRDETKKTLCDIYSHQLGNDKLALEIADRLHSMSYSKEIVKATVLTGDIAFRQAQTNIMEFADNMWWHIYNIACVPAISENNYTVKEKIEVMKKGIALFEVIFGGDYIYYHDRLANSYRQLAMLHLLIGETDNALDCVEAMSAHAIKFDTRPENANYSSILLNKIEYEKAKKGDSPEITLCSKLMRGRFQNRIWAPIKNDERFLTAIEAMSRYI